MIIERWITYMKKPMNAITAMIGTVSGINRIVMNELWCMMKESTKRFIKND